MRTERGSAAIEFMVMLGLVVFPMCGLLSVASWPEKMNAASAAAYEAARTVVEAPDPAAALDLARDRAMEVLSNHGVRTDDATVSFDPPSPQRGESLRATITITLPALTFPGVTRWDAFRWSRSDEQRVGDYRGYT